jgi:hypothetical protein
MAWLVQHGLACRLCAAGGAECAVLAADFLQGARARAAGDAQPKPGFMQALQGFGSLLLLPHTWGIVLLGMVSYASFLTVRGLWLSPMLMDRYQFSLVTTGNVALACFRHFAVRAFHVRPA